eukprot:1186570-Prorocentrum_minimum.AAC.1
MTPHGLLLHLARRGPRRPNGLGFERQVCLPGVPGVPPASLATAGDATRAGSARLATIQW